MILVDADTPGVNIVRDVATMEHPQEHFGRYGGHAEIVYDNVRVPKEALLGKEGEGFLIAQHRLGPGRIHHCMRWLGRLAARVRHAVRARRVAVRLRLASWPRSRRSRTGSRTRMAEMHAARLMTLHAAWKMDNEGASAARTEISLIKFYGAKVLHDVIDRAIQAHGALGYSTDLPLEQMYRYARAARFYDGADEVHRQSVARRVLRGYEPHEQPSEHVPTRREAARERFADLLEAVTSND